MASAPQIAVLGAALLAGGDLLAVDRPQNTSLTIVNGATSNLSEFYATKTNEEPTAALDLLKPSFVSSGTTKDVSVKDARETCQFDLLFVFADGQHLSRQRVNLCESAAFRLSDWARAESLAIDQTDYVRGLLFVTSQNSQWTTFKAAIHKDFVWDNPGGDLDKSQLVEALSLDSEIVDELAKILNETRHQCEMIDTDQVTCTNVMGTTQEYCLETKSGVTKCYDASPGRTFYDMSFLRSGGRWLLSNILAWD